MVNGIWSQTVMAPNEVINFIQFHFLNVAFMAAQTYPPSLCFILSMLVLSAPTILKIFSVLLEVSCIFHPLDISSCSFLFWGLFVFFGGQFIFLYLFLCLCVCVCVCVWHIPSLYASIKCGSDIPPVCFCNTHTSPTQPSPLYIITVDLFTPCH